MISRQVVDASVEGGGLIAGKDQGTNWDTVRRNCSEVQSACAEIPELSGRSSTNRMLISISLRFLYRHKI